MSVTTMGPEPIWGSTSNVHSLDRFRASAGSSQSRSWAISITVMNALQRNEMAADAVLANDNSVAGAQSAAPSEMEHTKARYDSKRLQGLSCRSVQPDSPGNSVLEKWQPRSASLLVIHCWIS